MTERFLPPPPLHERFRALQARADAAQMTHPAPPRPAERPLADAVASVKEYGPGFLKDPAAKRQLRQGLMDAGNRGVIAGALGFPVDMLNMTLGAVGVPTYDTPFMGSESIGNAMEHYGIVRGDRNHPAEALAGAVSMFPRTVAGLAGKFAASPTGLAAAAAMGGDASGALGITKPPGGNWLPGTVEGAIHNPMYTPEGPVTDWKTGALSKYVRNRMGTEQDDITRVLQQDPALAHWARRGMGAVGWTGANAWDAMTGRAIVPFSRVVAERAEPQTTNYLTRAPSDESRLGMLVHRYLAGQARRGNGTHLPEDIAQGVPQKFQDLIGKRTQHLTPSEAQAFFNAYTSGELTIPYPTGNVYRQQANALQQMASHALNSPELPYEGTKFRHSQLDYLTPFQKGFTEPSARAQLAEVPGQEWIGKIPLETPIWTLAPQRTRPLDFQHMADYLQQALAAGEVTPAQLGSGRLGVGDIFRETARNDAAITQKANADAAANGLAALKANPKGAETFQKLPNGYRWDRITTPERGAQECRAVPGATWCFKTTDVGSTYINPQRGTHVELLRNPEGAGEIAIQVRTDPQTGVRRVSQIRNRTQQATISPEHHREMIADYLNEHGGTDQLKLLGGDTAFTPNRVQEADRPGLWYDRSVGQWQIEDNGSIPSKYAEGGSVMAPTLLERIQALANRYMRNRNLPAELRNPQPEPTVGPQGVVPKLMSGIHGLQNRVRREAAAPAVDFATSMDRFHPTRGKLHDVYAEALVNDYGLSQPVSELNPAFEPGNWMGAGVIRQQGQNQFLTGSIEEALKSLRGHPRQEAVASLMQANPDITLQAAIDFVNSKPVSHPQIALNAWIDKNLTNYVRNDMATPGDPVRALAEAWPAKKQGLLQAKRSQIQKMEEDIARVAAERKVPPAVLGASQVRLENARKELDLIDRQQGLHYTTYRPHAMYAEGLGKARERAGFPYNGLASEVGPVQPFVANWENLSDRAINSNTRRDITNGGFFLDPEYGAKMLAANPWLNKLPADTPIYNWNTGLTASEGLGFRHLTDELANAINPASGLPAHLQFPADRLRSVSVPQAVERVAQINAWRAAKKSEADLLKANNAATTLHKEYPGQPYRWVELKAGDRLPEDVELQKVGTKGMKDFALVKDKKFLSNRTFKTEADAIKAANESYLQDALNYEADLMGNCVGGYCADVLGGRKRVFSLRDDKGVPHVSVEVMPGRKLTKADLPDSVRDYLAGFEGSKQDFEALVQKAIADQEIGAQITQIKGSGKKDAGQRILPEDAHLLPYVHDFVRSGRWSDVRDLENAGLRDTEVLKHLVSFPSRFMTPTDIRNHMRQSIDWRNAKPDSFSRRAQEEMGLTGVTDWNPPIEVKLREKYPNRHYLLDEETDPITTQFNTRGNPVEGFAAGGSVQPSLSQRFANLQARCEGGAVHMQTGGQPPPLQSQLPEGGVEPSLQEKVLNAARRAQIRGFGGRSEFGNSVQGRLGYSVPLSDTLSLTPYVQGFAFSPNQGPIFKSGEVGLQFRKEFKKGGLAALGGKQ